MNGAAIKMRVAWEGASIPTGDALELCRSHDGFRAQLLAALTAAPFDAYYWETPPVTAFTLGRPFEFLLPRLTWVAIVRLKAEATWLPAVAGRTCSP